MRVESTDSARDQNILRFAYHERKWFVSIEMHTTGPPVTATSFWGLSLVLWWVAIVFFQIRRYLYFVDPCTPVDRSDKLHKVCYILREIVSWKSMFHTETSLLMKPWCRSKVALASNNSWRTNPWSLESSCGCLLTPRQPTATTWRCTQASTGSKSADWWASAHGLSSAWQTSTETWPCCLHRQLLHLTCVGQVPEKPGNLPVRHHAP